MPDQTATTCAEVISNEVNAKFGCLQSLHSDQGRTMKAKSLLSYESCWEIGKTRTLPGNARCNGSAEHFNRTLLKMIKTYLKGEQRNWNKHLGCLAAAY